MRNFLLIYRVAARFPSCPRLNPSLGNFAISLGVLLGSSLFADAEPGLRFHKESQFEQAISQPLQANADKSSLRKYLHRLSTAQQVSILLDRRVDPTQRIEVAISAEFFDEGIRELVRQRGCDISVIADSIYVGPPETALFLNTRIEFARDELDEVESLSPKRQFELLRRYEVSWEDLTSPQEVLAKLADRYKVRIENLEELPHDLWSAGVIAYPNFIEASLLILTQYKLSFEWVDSDHVRLVREIADVGINQDHFPKGMAVEAAAALVETQHPDIQLRLRNDRLNFTGTVEQHAAVAVLVGEKLSVRQRKAATVSTQLRDRRFTFRMVNKPFGSLMATLQSQGIDVQYDAAQLQAANIQLALPISLELKEATIDQLLEKSCEKVGLTYLIEGSTILLVVPE